MNTKTLLTLILTFTFGGIALAEATNFQTIPLTTPIYSGSDPLGVNEIKSLTNKVVLIEKSITTVSNLVENKTYDYTEITNIGNLTNGLVNVSVLSGYATTNALATHTHDYTSVTNGFAKTSDIKITSITTNGVALAITNGVVDVPLQDYVKLTDLQEGIEFDELTVTNLTINGKKPLLEGDTIPATNITGLTTSKLSNDVITSLTNSLNNATTISDIKSVLNTFILKFKEEE